LLSEDALTDVFTVCAFAKVPKVPAAVENVGADDAVKLAEPDLTDPPSLFSILIK